MLSVFRKNANNWFMVIIFAVITFVFVFTFGSWGGGDVSGQVPIAATVNGKVIPLSLFKAQYAQTFRMMSTYRPGFTAEKAREEKLDETVLDRLITQELLAQSAESHGLVITDEEVKEAILERFFGKDKPFDPEEYKRLVNGVYGTTEARFEAQLRRELLANRFETILTDAQHVSDNEVKEQFASKNDRADLDTIRIDPAFFKAKDATDAEVKTWVDAHKSDVEKFYNEHMNRYRQPKKVKARHILAKVAETATDEDKKKAREKVEGAKKRIEAGEDFAKVAEELSEDGSAKSGGDLGFFGPGAMVKPFEDAAFNLEKGKLSDIVESRFGYHVIRVDDVQPPVTKELKDVELEIGKELLKDDAQMAAARKVADEILAELQKGTALSDLKTPNLVKPNADGSPAKPGDYDPLAPRMENTGWFAKTARVIPRIGVAPDVVKLAFEQLSMDKPLHGSVVEVNKRLYIVRLKAREMPDPAKLAEERESIEQSLLAGRRSQIVEQFTKTLRDKARIEKTPDLLTG
jgi:peptidyl-prolyl cis-trans isomerase D